MSCDAFRKLLEDYQYGELSEVETSQVAGHLRDCAACRGELAGLEREAGLFHQYATETESSIRLSPEIWTRASSQPETETTVGREAGLGGGKVGSQAFMTRRPWIRQAIAALLLVGVSVTGTLLVERRYRTRESNPPLQAEALQGMGEGLQGAVQSVQRAEQEYLRAIQQLSAVVEKQKSTLDPRVIADLQNNLKLIDAHIAATRRAYYAHPQDPELGLFMLAAYSRKVQLLQDLTS
jgi:hypothetical protein